MKCAEHQRDEEHLPYIDTAAEKEAVEQEVMSKKTKATKLAALIVGDIIDDLSDRRGLSQEWGQIDDEIRRDIVKEWMELARKRIDEGG